jgi:hypothetical protein
LRALFGSKRLLDVDLGHDAAARLETAANVGQDFFVESERIAEVLGEDLLGQVVGRRAQPTRDDQHRGTRLRGRDRIPQVFGTIADDDDAPQRQTEIEKRPGCEARVGVLGGAREQLVPTASISMLIEAPGHPARDADRSASWHNAASTVCGRSSSRSAAAPATTSCHSAQCGDGHRRSTACSTSAA